MTLTKAQITDSISKQAPMLKAEATETVEVLLEIIKSALESGDDVLISGFGKFCVKDKRKRRGRNPETGRSMVLKKRRVVTFKCSGLLRKRINAKKRKTRGKRRK